LGHVSFSLLDGPAPQLLHK